MHKNYQVDFFREFFVKGKTQKEKKIDQIDQKSHSERKWETANVTIYNSIT